MQQNNPYANGNWPTNGRRPKTNNNMLVVLIIALALAVAVLAIVLVVKTISQTKHEEQRIIVRTENTATTNAQETLHAPLPSEQPAGADVPAQANTQAAPATPVAQTESKASSAASGNYNYGGSIEYISNGTNWQTTINLRISNTHVTGTYYFDKSMNQFGRSAAEMRLEGSYDPNTHEIFFYETTEKGESHFRGTLGTDGRLCGLLDTQWGDFNVNLLAH